MITNLSEILRCLWSYLIHVVQFKQLTTLNFSIFFPHRIAFNFELPFEKLGKLPNVKFVFSIGRDISLESFLTKELRIYYNVSKDNHDIFRQNQQKNVKC